MKNWLTKHIIRIELRKKFVKIEAWELYITPVKWRAISYV